MAKLTKRVVDNAEPRASDFFIWCDELPGFGVRVFASGRKGYVVQYRAAGRTRRIALGAHGVITAEEARKLARGHLGDVAKGGDPAEERATRRSSITMAELCDDYTRACGKGMILGKRGLPKKASTLDTDRGRIERHIKPLLGRKLVKEITRADVARFIHDVIAGKTATVEKTGLRGKAVVEGGRGAATRTAGLLGGILSYAVSVGVIEINPATGVRRPADGKRSRRLTPEELRALGKALDAAEAEGEGWQAIAGTRLFAFTGCRLQEIERLKWSEVDIAGQCLRLHDSKEGASVRPLGRPAIRVLEGVRRESGAIFVLPAARGGEGPYGGLPGGVKRLTERAGLSGVTSHVMRHTLASIAGDLQFSRPTIAALLGQAGGTVTDKYIHHLDAVLLAAADKVAGEVQRQMAGV
ncbi:tyrosine-type recombinase/integrase [Methylopila sp. Yamaguchi]|uniref:tyrosine-type recombinase/integrase n=1 Tax=Methylopila sp. Yamaguchi TaxID=1437817 RepID=UPI000CC7A2EF|nr:site-specific integrase [Methylopila sp. Yamaguchi]GBD50242.1 phage integrase [Methylopila sp. Yamaguchi]